MPKSWDTGQQVPEKDRGWRFEVKIEEEWQEIGVVNWTALSPQTLTMLVRYDGNTVFEADLNKFTLYGRKFMDFGEDLERLNTMLRSEAKLRAAFEDLGQKMREAGDQLIENLRKGRGDMERKDAGGQ